MVLIRNTVVWRSTAAAEGIDNKTRDKGDRSTGYGSRNQNSSSATSWKTNRTTPGASDSRSSRDPSSSKFNSSQSSGSSGAWTKASSGSAARTPWRKNDSTSGDQNFKRDKDQDRSTEAAHD